MSNKRSLNKRPLPPPLIFGIVGIKEKPVSMSTLFILIEKMEISLEICFGLNLVIKLHD